MRSYSNKHGVVDEVSGRTMLHELLNTHVRLDCLRMAAYTSF